MLHHESWQATFATYLFMNFHASGNLHCPANAFKNPVFVCAGYRTYLITRTKQKNHNFFSCVYSVFKPNIQESLHFVHTCIYVQSNGITHLFIFPKMVRHVYLYISVKVLQ